MTENSFHVEKNVEPTAAASGMSVGRQLLVLGGILLFALGVRVALIDRPFERDNEGLQSFYGILARNYLRYDVGRTLGVPVQSMGVTDKPPTFYGHHPLLVPVFIAGAYAILGQGDWQTRLPTVLFTLGCIALVWHLIRGRVGLIAAFLFAAVPMTIYYGGHADCINSQLVFFVLLTVAGYLRLHERASWTNFFLLCGAFVGAGLTDWPAFYLVVVLFGHYVFTRPVRSWGWMVGFGFFSTVLFVASYAQSALAYGDWKWMSEVLHHRALSNVADRTGAFSLGQWIRQALGDHAVGFHTWPVIIAAMIGVGIGMRRRTRERTYAYLLLGWAVLHFAVGKQGVYVHQWWSWPLTPGVVIAAAIAVNAMWGRWPGMKIPTVAAMIVLGGWSTYSMTGMLWDRMSTQGYPLGLDKDPYHDNFTVREIGQAIREAAAPNHAVALAEQDLNQISLWYYGDRPLIMRVWWSGDLEAKMQNLQFVDSPFGYIEPWTEPPVAMVLPKAYARVDTSFLKYLEARYPRKSVSAGVAAKFHVFDLTGVPAKMR